jgi:ATP-dependent RNA helicase DOB1
MEKFNDVLPELDPVQDMGINDSGFKADLEHLKKLENEIVLHPLRKRADFDVIYSQFESKMQLKQEMELAKRELKSAKYGQFNEELEKRTRVLRRLNYVDKDNVTQKGRIACEISAADEILLTEMLLTGVFNDMTPADAAALLSCFVFEEKTDKKPQLDDKLQQAYNTLVVR